MKALCVFFNILGHIWTVLIAIVFILSIAGMFLSQTESLSWVETCYADAQPLQHHQLAGHCRVPLARNWFLQGKRTL